MSLNDDVIAAANKLAKWRTVFAGWQLGTRPKSDPEAAAVRDHREATMLLRAEVNAVTALLLAHGVCTAEDFQRQVIAEYQHLDAAYERQFPGFRSTDEGMSIDAKIAAETTKGWKP